MLKEVSNLVVTSDTAPARLAISTFITKFTDLQAYLMGKTATTKNATTPTHAGRSPAILPSAH
jgi:hypothetical protein